MAKVMPLRDAVRRYPVLAEFLPIDLFDAPDYMVSVSFENGKRHFSIFDGSDPLAVASIE